MKSFCLLVTCAVFAAGCAPMRAPPMARGAAMTYGVESPEWSARLRTRFPVGTPQAEVIAGLGEEGFEIHQGSLGASYDWSPNGGYPCSYTLTAAWTLDAAQRLASIKGGYWNICV
jgi:hypothetical protein